MIVCLLERRRKRQASWSYPEAIGWNISAVCETSWASWFKRYVMRIWINWFLCDTVTQILKEFWISNTWLCRQAYRCHQAKAYNCFDLGFVIHLKMKSCPSHHRHDDTCKCSGPFSSPLTFTVPLTFTSARGVVLHGERHGWAWAQFVGSRGSPALTILRSICW